MVNASSMDAAIDAQSSRMAAVALKNERCEFEQKTEVEELKKRVSYWIGHPARGRYAVAGGNERTSEVGEGTL